MNFLMMECPVLNQGSSGPRDYVMELCKVGKYSH